MARIDQDSSIFQIITFISSSKRSKRRKGSNKSR
jgi:hypothetical protein